MKIFKPKVSVIMNCHNGQEFLKESLVSVKNQTYKNWEIIFFDNNSSDNSKKILKNFSNEKIKYFKSSKFLKLYNARNKAIEKSTGEYICFLDTDDIWAKDKLSQQINFIKKKRIQILFSNYYILNTLKKSKLLRSKNKLPSGKITQNLLNDYSIGILTTIMHKNIFKKMKFNNKFEIIGDFDFFLRSSLKYKIYSINKPLATYRFHSKNLSKIKLNTYISELEFWIKKNDKRLKNYNLFKFKFYLIKLKIKQLLLH